jgi:hypothetical protein
MSTDLRRTLQSVSPPDETGAERRAWSVVRAAFAEREPVERRRSFVRPVLVLAVVAAVIAAAASPPGRAVLGSIRKALAPTRVERAEPALFSLPAPGRLLVESTAGVWVVHADGSKRLLHPYREAGWSPHGRFVVGSSRNRLAALEPGGVVHWTLARPDISFPAWGGTRTDTRIAYFTKARVTPALRVVAGNGTHDHWVAKDFLRVAPVWQPGTVDVLALAHVDGRVRIWATDRRALIGTSPPGLKPVQLAWSSDGRRLFVLERHRLLVLGPRARPIARRRLPTGWRATAMAVQPHAGAIAVSLASGRQSEVLVLSHGRVRRAFAGTGEFSGLAWSPGSRWLLIALKDADQWVFVGSGGRLSAVSNIKEEFKSNHFPTLAGWCCAR